MFEFTMQPAKPLSLGNDPFGNLGFGNASTGKKPYSSVTFTSHSVPSGAQGVVFVSPNMWTVNGGAGVSKVAPDGTATNYSISGFANASGIAYDGSTYLWACDNSAGKVFKIDLSGNLIASYNVANGTDICFDGTNMWTCAGSGVSKITPAGSVTNYSYSGTLERIRFDGTNLWCTDIANGGIVKVSLAGSFTFYPLVGSAPYGLCFDGTNMWTGNIGDNSLSKVSPSGVETNYPGAAATPRGLAFDGTFVWATGYSSTKVSISDLNGVIQQFGTTDANPWAMAWDGSAMWVVCLAATIEKAVPS